MSVTTLPAGFRKVGENIVYDNGDAFLTTWHVVGPFESVQFVARRWGLSQGEAVLISNPGYLTPKVGRFGWNFRATAPKANFERGIGFIVNLPGQGIFKFVPTKAKVRVR